ncbi:MAG: LysM peptidoglycan-binding domain-containing protein [Candidatus Promineifilaceae bacterium]|nr:LysM peptidoglycan-binding domain-containing protein [Candidatus Promineifilaceae bacterium]
MKMYLYTLLMPLIILIIAGCTATPEQLEVTRIVTEQIPVTVEVTRIVVQEILQEVPVEVTRLVAVELSAEPTAVPMIESTSSPTVEPSPTSAVTGVSYIVQPGDSLSSIAEEAGTSIAALQAANNMDANTVLIAGQEIFIPGADAELPVSQPPAPTSTPVPVAEQPPAVVAEGANLLPNPSFEGEWYFHIYNELQVPDGWQLTVDEGPNNLEQGAGGLFNRPEVRVISLQDLSPDEQRLFILNGNKTVKAFKGGAPTSFALFTDVSLPPGGYRMTINFVPDSVAGYDGGQKIHAANPIAGEARLIIDGGGIGWQGTISGQRNTLTYDFTVDETRSVRVGGAFRNRFILDNNGWFIDDWSLTPLVTSE